MIYNDIEKNTNRNKLQERIFNRDQSSQWTFELITVMCRYELGLATCYV